MLNLLTTIPPACLCNKGSARRFWRILLWGAWVWCSMMYVFLFNEL